MNLTRRVAVVVSVGLVLYAIALALRIRTGAPKYASARARADEACRAYRSRSVFANADVCREHDAFGPRVIPTYKETEALLAKATGELARGETGAARGTLARVVEMLDRIERRGSVVAEIAAKRIVNQVLDLLEEHRELDPREVLRDVRFEFGQEPLESEKLQHLWMLAHYDQRSLGGFSSATGGTVTWMSDADLARTMESEEAAFSEMDRALQKGDVESCTRAASRIVVTTIDWCEQFADVATLTARLDKARRTGDPSRP